MICADTNHPQRATWMPTNDQLAANPSPINELQHSPKQKAPTKAGAFHYNWYRKQESNLRPAAYGSK